MVKLFELIVEVDTWRWVVVVFLFIKVVQTFRVREGCHWHPYPFNIGQTKSRLGDKEPPQRLPPAPLNTLFFSWKSPIPSHNIYIQSIRNMLKFKYRQFWLIRERERKEYKVKYLYFRYWRQFIHHNLEEKREPLINKYRPNLFIILETHYK